MTANSGFENAYALIVGISKYKDQRISELRFTRADAEGIFKLLTDPDMVGFKPDNIKLLLDWEATRFNIKNAISSWLFKNADENSVVFIYFAGHGGVEEDRLGIEKDKLSKYLIPYDAVLDDLFSSAISNRDFNELLLTIKSKKLVIFMDTCYSGGVSERQARDLKITDDPYRKIGEGEGRIVIAASQPDQRSFEDSRIGHGVFTDNLLKALSGEADWNKDGYVTVLDAYKYLEDSVPKAAMQLAGGTQEPILRGDIKKDFIISVNRKRREEIEKEKDLETKLAKLREFFYEGKFSGKLYEKLRKVVKTGVDSLQKKDRYLPKLLHDLYSGDISIDTFLEDLRDTEPELFEPVKETKEQETLGRKEGELRKEEEKEDIEKKEIEKAAKKEEKPLEEQREEKKPIKKEKKQIRITENIKKIFKKEILILIIIISAGMILYFLWPHTPPPQQNGTPTPTATPTSTPLPEWISPGGIVFIQIPAGGFDMGSPSSEEGRYPWEGPLHNVEIAKAFYIGKYEVTNRQWYDIMGNNPSAFKGDNLPVEQLSWDDVQKFIKNLNEKERTTKYRLPSEAEWEYAARAGTTLNYSFGDNKSKLGEYAWYNENSGGVPHPVGQKIPNPWGLYDVHGNVWEWVQDEWHDNYNDAPTDGSAWKAAFVAKRVVRGGSWNNLAENCRSAFRFYAEQSESSTDLGFRLVRDV